MELLFLFYFLPLAAVIGFLIALITGIVRSVKASDETGKRKAAKLMLIGGIGLVLMVLITYTLWNSFEFRR